MTKFYRPKGEKYMGRYASYDVFGEPYFVEIDEKGHHRYTHSDRESKWSKTEDKDFAHYIKNGDWLEVPELPEKPWKW